MKAASSKRVTKFFSSNWFLLIVLLLFVSEAGWLAATSRYPMAFDESYHFGMIQFFSHHLNPIVTNQPASTYGLGAIAHNPSFLYHYLMAFPYLLVSYFTHSLQTQVITLRFINIGFIVASLFFIRKILQSIHIPAVLVNLILLAFALTPVVTALSAQINYDNLLVLTGTICVYETLLFTQRLHEGILDVQRLLMLLCLCLFGSEVKFAFPPIFAGIAAVIGWQLIAYRRRHKDTFRSELTSSFRRISRPAQLSLAAGIIVGAGLFTGSYGYNLVKYHNPVPQCEQILSIQDCKQYYSWDRNYTLMQYEKSHTVALQMNTLQYTWLWLKVEYYQLFAEIVPTGGMIHIAKTFYTIIISLTVVALVCTLVSIKKIIQYHRAFLAISVIAFAYLLCLWARNYHDYLYLKQPVAIQGRYVVPVLMYAYALCGLGVKYALESKRSTQVILQPVMVVLVVFSFVYFGGYVRYASNISPSTGWLPQPTYVAALTNSRPK